MLLRSRRRRRRFILDLHSCACFSMHRCGAPLSCATEPPSILRCTNVPFFFTFARFSPAPVSLFSRSRLRGTQGGRLYTTAQVWVPAGLLGAYSGRPKARNLASNRGIAVRPASANQAHANPKNANNKKSPLCCCF